MSAYKPAVLVCLLVGLVGGTAAAMNIETVPVGNTGNAGELSGEGAGAYGPNRICGAVDYTYNIGKYEVTAGQYCDFLNAVAATDTYGLYNTNMWSDSYGCKIQQTGTSGSYAYSVAGNYAYRPVNFVSYWDACRFANWLSNGQPTGAQDAGTTETGTYTLDGYNSDDGREIQRNAGWKWAVTSEDEWYKAAYFSPATSSYYNYPTSSITAPGRDLDDASGNNANHYTGSGAYPIDFPYYTTVAGEFQNSASPYGTFDQGGNVWEWDEAVVYQDAASRGARGGSFLFAAPLVMNASLRTGNNPSTESCGIGFRVVEVPEPGCALLLAIASLGIVSRRRRA